MRLVLRTCQQSLLAWLVHDNHPLDVCLRDISDHDQSGGSSSLQDESEEELPRLRPRRLNFSALAYIMYASDYFVIYSSTLVSMYTAVDVYLHWIFQMCLSLSTYLHFFCCHDMIIFTT